jgi:hypothetical protein
MWFQILSVGMNTKRALNHWLVRDRWGPRPHNHPLSAKVNYMNMPPDTIDNAEVLYWAWSGDRPFGVLKYTDGSVAAEIYGLAICRYNKSETIYRFSCDKNWETEQDSNYASVEDAMGFLPEQYKNVQVNWIKFEK